MKSKKGFTLIQMLITVTILVTTTAIGLPNLLNLIAKLKVDNEIYRLFNLLQIARNSAINHGKPTTLCPLDQSNKCTNKWQNSLSVFIDINNNKVFEPSLNESLIAYKKAISKDDILQYGKYRKSITYSPTGYLAGWGQNGTFKYCPKGYLKLARGIIVATSGRMYKTYQTKLGIDKNRRNKTIICR